jgi:transmembrane sensor
MNQSQQDIGEQLLYQYLLGNADEESRVIVEAWLKADSRNRHTLDRIESLWLETGKLSPAPVAVDVNAAWLRMSEKISKHAQTERPYHENGKTFWMLPYRYLAGAAAMVILLVGIYSIYRLVGKPQKQIELASGTVVIHQTLPDGSQVSLNKNSKLIFPVEFKKGNREVILMGEAFFEVRHDEAHPFIVHTGPAGIRVLGTSFRVNAHPVRVGDPVRVVEVDVTEGRVMLFNVKPRSGDTASVLLHSGETGIWQSGTVYPIRTGSTAPDGNFWANHSLDFRSTTLSEVIRLIEKYYSVNITVSDTEILDCRLTASFVYEPPERILAVIAESFSLKLDVQGQNFHLTGHGCSKDHN